MSSPAKPQQSKPYAGARSIALTILLKIHRQQPFADDVVDSLLQSMKVQSLDRGLIVELVYGVLRHQGTLDWRLNQVAKRPMSRLPVTVAMIFRLGAYQLLYLDKIPHSAAVNESVKLAKTVGGRNWSGLVNGILRNLMRQPTQPWPDPSDDPVSALSIRYSCPSWLVQRWLSVWGNQRTEALCEATLQIPPITLRTNLLRCSRDELATRLRLEGYEVQETTVSPSGLILEKCGKLNDLGPLIDGWCYIEDEAAQLIPLLLDLQPEDQVLDVCAAPGGKTTHMGQLMSNQGHITAVDRDLNRLNLLISNYHRLGLTNITPVCANIIQEIPASTRTSSLKRHERSVTSLFTQQFDRILVDAPCSGLGVLRRHPEGKWLKGPNLIQQAQVLQGKILDRVSPLLRPGGVLVYSACSTEIEETRHVLATFLDQHPDFHQDSIEPWVPPAGQTLIDETGCLLTSFNAFSMDGFFAARLRKRTS